MSRVGKQVITIPEKTDVSQSDGIVTVSGPHGTLTRTFKDSVSVNINEETITLEPTHFDKESRSLWGTYASHISNMIQGVNEPYEKKLVVEGVGYRAEMKGDTLVLSVGFSHSVEIRPTEGVSLSVEKAVITISGINKEDVGKVASEIRAVKKPEPYKGKGIRYEDEVVRRKEGKKSV